MILLGHCAKCEVMGMQWAVKKAVEDGKLQERKQRDAKYAALEKKGNS